MPLAAFHPAVAAWFRRRFSAPTAPQSLAWPEIRAGRHTLIAAPTGSGKTLAAFLAAIDDLVRQGVGFPLADATQVVYVSPLKALSNDIQRNLEEPLAGIRAELEERLADVEIRTLLRTGDTPAAERTAMLRRPPHLLVTTPESLYILLTSDGGRRLLATTRTVIIDEIHALAGNRRGAHLALTLERLEALTGRRLQRIGLSATQRPIEEAARFLVGAGAVGANGAPDCAIVDAGHRRDLDLDLEVTASPLEAVMPGEVWAEVYDRLAELCRAHRTTLVFVNTRRLSERISRHLGERLGESLVAAHHGSLSRERRLEAEARLKAGDLRALVATASLELGIDIGSVDLVCQIGSPRAISVLLQRAGRSGHALARLPKARVFPTSRDEATECAALLRALRQGDLETLAVPRQPLDVLAQQIVAATACEEWGEADLFERFRRAWPYRDLQRTEFDEVVRMLAEGFLARRGRRGAYLHLDAVHGKIRGRRGARLAAITSGGAIPDTADYPVIQQPAGSFVGTVNEDFAIESMAGDIFQLGNVSWRIQRIDQGRVLVEDARGAPPTIPFWIGEAPGRSPELSRALSGLRADVELRLLAGGVAAAAPFIAETAAIRAEAALQIAEHLAGGHAALGMLPTQERLAVERFFDEAGDLHIVIHSPYGSRLNRAWGLALRKRLCRTFNFELQAAATEDGIVLSLGPTHTFPPEDLFRLLTAESAAKVLTQAMLDAPMFGIRWRWNLSRSLAVLRFAGGRKVPPRLQRMQAEDLLALVFPDALACLENVVGDRTIPDHPLVRQTLRDCLEEASDLAGLERLLGGLESGAIQVKVLDLREPSPLAHEVLTARPYAFLDDAPLEERRTQAVVMRRWTDPAAAADLGSLDLAAIDRVREEAWPDAESADELHDALVLLGFLTPAEVERSGWEGLVARLALDGRAARFSAPGTSGCLWVAAERLPPLRAIHPEAAWSPPIAIPERYQVRGWGRSEALVEILRARLEGLGPVSATNLAGSLGVEASAVDLALSALEGEGFLMRGRFTPGADAVEWCERGLLARIHRATLDRLRREIEPVPPAVFQRFLFAWQGLGAGERRKGGEALALILDQLEGFEAPAAAWESEILPARLDDYQPGWLDSLCQAGRYAWGRLTAPPPTDARRTGPIRTTPIALVSRARLPLWRAVAAGASEPPRLGASAAALLAQLERRGASFFGELVAAEGMLATEAEGALGELAAWGLVTSDAFSGLRALLTPAGRRPAAGESLRRRRHAAFGMDAAGRWSLLRAGVTIVSPATAAGPEAEAIAAVLLRRYGVVFRRALEREGLLPPWRDLLRVFRRLEARGEIRGGRFVDGFTGEQYALPEAVGRLRAIRRQPPTGDLVAVSAADPAHLACVPAPWERVAALAGNRVLYRDGEPIAVRERKTERLFAALDPAQEWEARAALRGRRVAPAVRSYLKARP